MKIYKYLIFVILFAFISSCGDRYYATPGIEVHNMSDNYIDNIKIVWGGGYLLHLDYPKEPGMSGSFHMAVRNKSQMYGPVHIEWVNAKGKLIQEDFIFKKEQLSKGGYLRTDNIIIFFTQDDMELFTRFGKNPRSEEVKKRSQKVEESYQIFKKLCPKGRENCKARPIIDY